MSLEMHAYVMQEWNIINPLPHLSKHIVRREVRRLSNSVRELRFEIERLKIELESDILKFKRFTHGTEKEKIFFMLKKACLTGKNALSNIVQQMAGLRKISQDISFLVKKQYSESCHFSDDLDKRIDQLEELTIKNEKNKLREDDTKKEIAKLKHKISKKMAKTSDKKKLNKIRKNNLKKLSYLQKELKKKKKALKTIKKQTKIQVNNLRKKLAQKKEKIKQALSEITHEIWKKSKRQAKGWLIFKEALNNSTIDSISTKLKAGVKEAVLLLKTEKESIKKKLKIGGIESFESALERLYEIEISELLSLHKSIEEQKILIRHAEDDLEFIKTKGHILKHDEDFVKELEHTEKEFNKKLFEMEKQSKLLYNSIAA